MHTAGQHTAVIIVVDVHFSGSMVLTALPPFVGVCGGSDDARMRTSVLLTSWAPSRAPCAHLCASHTGDARTTSRVSSAAASSGLVRRITTSSAASTVTDRAAV